MRVLVPVLLSLLAGLLLGFGLSQWVRPATAGASAAGAPRAPVPQASSETPAAAAATLAPSEVRMVEVEPPAEVNAQRASVDQAEELATLRDRVRTLEARLAALADGAEPRLASDRLRLRSQLRDALDQQSLRYEALYRDFLDFVTRPALIAEHPLEYLDCLERALRSSGVAGRGELDPDSQARVLRMDGEEGEDGGLILFKRFARRSPTERDGVWVEWTLPNSLPLPHMPHLEYGVHATFGLDGALKTISLSLRGVPGFSLQRLEDGGLSIGGARSAPRRSPQEREQLYADLSLAVRRLASLGR